jgi:DeoR/GlpR family transcriptional regulator of sugar metabolism
MTDTITTNDLAAMLGVSTRTIRDFEKLVT